MVIGSSLDAVMSVAKPPDADSASASDSAASSTSGWCTMPQHKKIIDKVGFSFTTFF